MQSPAGALAAAQAREYDAALIDMNYARDTTSGGEGELDLLAKLRELDPALPVVVMTAWGSVAGAVEAMKRGARDYVEKPWQNDRLLATLRTQVELRVALKSEVQLREGGERERGRRVAHELIASSKAMMTVRRLMDRVAESDASVLITGEHGTGKDVVARLIHAASTRAEEALHRRECGRARRRRVRE